MKYEVAIPLPWEGDTALILAGGPSLRGTNLKPYRYKALRWIAINDSWRLKPHADVLYFCDEQWWTSSISRNLRSLENDISFHELIYKGFWITTAPGFSDHPQVLHMELTGERGLDMETPSGLRHGSNSGYQAINLAAKLGAKRILLLGYDMRVAGNRIHWHDESSMSAEAYKTVLEKSMLPHFPSLLEPLAKAGTEVINVTPNSALTCFPMMMLEQALEPCPEISS
jgi:hypothetical protein